jgi:hypothetical protein
VSQALVAADLHLALDVLGDVATQVALDLEVLVDPVADAGDLFVGEVADAGVGSTTASQICWRSCGRCRRCR